MDDRKGFLTVRKDDKFNGSGCKDMTAYKALENIEAEERLRKFLKKVFKIAEYYGFHIDERIVVTDTRTGKKWR